jgi:hypothetical protein
MGVAPRLASADPLHGTTTTPQGPQQVEIERPQRRRRAVQGAPDFLGAAGSSLRCIPTASAMALAIAAGEPSQDAVGDHRLADMEVQVVHGSFIQKGVDIVRYAAGERVALAPYIYIMRAISRHTQRCPQHATHAPGLLPRIVPGGATIPLLEWAVQCQTDRYYACRLISETGCCWYASFP